MCTWALTSALSLQKQKQKQKNEEKNPTGNFQCPLIYAENIMLKHNLVLIVLNRVKTMQPKLFEVLYEQNMLFKLN